MKVKEYTNIQDYIEIKKFEKKLPMKHSASPDEIENFVKSILNYKIKYLNGVTINFDGGLSDFLF